MIDHVQKYIDEVENGNILVCEKIQMAIDRHKKDIERSKRDDFPYYYEPKYTQNIVKFISMLPDPKSGKPNKLALFQKFILGMLWGWRRKKDNTKRFRKAYLSLARKQGKSLIVSGIALYCLIYERNPRQARQIYATANKRDQAKIVFTMVKSQLKALRGKSKAIQKFTKVLQNELTTTDDSFMKPLSADADTLDGLDTLLGIFDEYALSKTTEMMDVIETSMGQQIEPLTIIISTASSKLNYPMYSIEYQYVTKLLKEEVVGDEYLALCWEQDNAKEVADTDMWIKSNPLMELSEQKERLTESKKRLLDEGKAKGSISNVLTKEFNIWVQSSQESYMSEEEWTSAVAPDYIKQTDLTGREIYIGVDLSRVNDLTSISWVIPIREESKFFVDSYSFVANRGGIEAKEKEDKTPYRQYEQAGYCTISSSPDGLIDYHDLVNWLTDFIESNNFELKGIFYDPYNAGNVITDLSKFYEKEMIEVRQGLITLNVPTKQFRTDVIKGKTVHSNNPLLNRAIRNAITKENNDTIMIDKAMNRNKIDPLDALINAYTQAMYHDFDEEDINELIERGEYGFGW
ncbi:MULTISPECIES: terminase large subunit [Enterococcus]|jgi:phage terminase large subunit-like protein|uniref:terminase large subunit n=1 Tax=Enterococcus TaxID=1350 RepID=UPI0002A2598B|nr:MULTISPECIES: terminase TerL endonuclease subunit [Enterococcus]DAL34097.1 MAG TPA_asm: Large Terminase [Caudoviricetes sp.]ALF50642.1 terminase [Enterococcus faecium]ALL10538.1 terminase [Enterococcus faecium]EGP4728576.1 terminase large subunit [Enterococcus faecium]EGP5651833.1 terminase large subunit [Enterococcus faecium]